jgi:hypothetical protein
MPDTAYCHSERRADLPHMTKNSVIPTGAERSGGTYSWGCIDKNRSLDYAARWAASLGMTE